MTDDLKTCPFCEKGAHVWSAGTYYGVECKRRTLPCVSLPAVYLSKADAIRAWNMRPIEEKLEDIIYRKQEF